ncbi:MAG: Gfo/Idh/MocA family oxidoreductase [Bacteroidetes bacterium]|nr:Gfo/Idh/MocA family oxidoreductase [Bacteroidota bacterium]MDA1119112.1 Gfo/Idh/MocA family oxidoreductase [Bacteroidota bacterium]
MEYKKIEESGLIRIVLLGCGFATRIHSKTLSRFDNIYLYFASNDIRKATDYNKKYFGKGAYGNYEEAITDENIDVILIATPPINHLELTLKALEAGKHVIVEKPPYLKSEDFEIIRKAAEKSGTQVLIAENYYYKPVAMKLRKVLDSGVIGKPLFLYVNATKTQKTGDWRDDTNVSGGGALFEGGIHWVNFMANLGLEVEEVRGWQPGSAEDSSKSHNVTFKYKNGPIGTLLYSWEVNTSMKGVRISRIYGTEGSVTFESNGVFIYVRGKKRKFIWPGITDIAGYKGMFRDFFDALRKGVPPKFTFDMAKRDVELIERCVSHP